MEPKIPKVSVPGHCSSEGRCQCICSEEPEYCDTIREHEGTGRCVHFLRCVLSHIKTTNLQDMHRFVYIYMQIFVNILLYIYTYIIYIYTYYLYFFFFTYRMFIPYIYIYTSLMTASSSKKRSPTNWQAAARNVWMDALGFVKGGSLAKQRSGIIEKLCLGGCREAEAQVLKAVEFKNWIPGNYNVCLDEQRGWFKATFELDDGQSLSKRCETLQQVNDWLMSTVSSFKSGALSGSLKKMETAAKPEVAKCKAAVKVAESQGTKSIAECVKEAAVEGTASACTHLAKDVTAEFLAPVKYASVDFCGSTVCVHRGSLNTYAKLAYSDHQVSALLLGKEAWNGKMHVVNMVMSTGPAENLIDNDRVKARCTALSLVPCGMVTVGKEEHWTPKLREEITHVFFSYSSSPILIVYTFEDSVAGRHLCWEFDSEQSRWTAASLSWTTQPKGNQPRLNYNICWVNELGTSQLSAATEAICHALVKSTCQKLQGKKCRQSGEKHCIYDRYLYIYIYICYIWKYIYIYICIFGLYIYIFDMFLPVQSYIYIRKYLQKPSPGLLCSHSLDFVELSSLGMGFVHGMR